MLFVLPVIAKFAETFVEPPDVESTFVLITGRSTTGSSAGAQQRPNAIERMINPAADRPNVRNFGSVFLWRDDRFIPALRPTLASPPKLGEFHLGHVKSRSSRGDEGSVFAFLSSSRPVIAP